MNKPPVPEFAPTFLTLKALYAALVGVIFTASVFLAILLADHALASIQLAQNVVAGAVYFALALVFLLGGGLILLSALAQLWQAVKLERRGEVVEATLVEKRLEKDKKGNRYCFIVYSFNPEFRVKQSIDQEAYLRLKESDKLKVRYLPSNPVITRLEHGKESTNLR
jgi:uncharacterized protein (DUF58 family)